MNIDGTASEILHIHPPPPRFLYHLFCNSCLINCLSAFLIHLIYIQNYRIMVCLWVEWEFNVCSPCITEDDYSGRNKSSGWFWLSLFLPLPIIGALFFSRLCPRCFTGVTRSCRNDSSEEKDVSFQKWDLNSGSGGGGKEDNSKRRGKYKLTLWEITWHYLCSSGFFCAWLSLSRQQMDLRSQKLSNFGNLFCRQTSLCGVPPLPPKGAFFRGLWHSKKLASFFPPNLIIQTAASHAFINSSAEQHEMESSKSVHKTC